MNAKKRDEIAFHALCHILESPYLYSQDITTFTEDDIKREVKEINEQTIARNLFAKKLRYKQMPKESLTKWIADLRKTIREMSS